MSDRDRLEWLERHGRIPEDADWKDRDLASQTTWWGKPLDPKEFWKDRVVWCDESAKAAAAVRGRAFPPIPEEYAALARKYQDDGKVSWGTPAIDGPKVARGTAMTWKEGAFWIDFIRTHPKPPETLHAQQSEMARSVLVLRKSARETNRPPHRRFTPEEIERSIEVGKRQELEMGYPPEIFSEDALHWAYVLETRKEYQELVTQGHKPEDLPVRLFTNGVLVDLNYITEPLTDEQMRAANAWKIAYLQRLRREKVDESYIRAYLQAWQLSEADVFGGANKP
jgi:hypothetical protein